MKSRLYLVLLAVALSSCAAPRVIDSTDRKTIGSNPRLPQQEIRPFYSQAEWDIVRAAEYSAYAVVSVQIQKDRTVSSPRVVEAYPDRSRDKLAIQFAKTTRLFAPTVGSRVTPSGEVFVIFFESDFPHKALVFGRPSSAAAPVGFTTGTRYLKVFSY